MDPVESAMNPIGERLKRERESKEFSRVDVAKATKIAAHHILAIEYSDFTELPEPVHVKGYIRAYADFLGLDPTAVLADFLVEYEAVFPNQGKDPRDEVVLKMSKMLGGSSESRASVPRAVLIVVASAALIALVWIGWRWLKPEGSSSPAAPVTVVTPEPSAEVPSTSAEIPSEALAPAAQPEAETAEVTPPPQLKEAVEVEQQTGSPQVEVPAPASATELRITQYGVGSGVENRRLIGESDVFTLNTRVWFWNRVEGGRSGETVHHVWRLEGRVMSRTPLRIGSANWRTQSRKTLYAGSAGSWTVEAIDESGNVLARSEFTCTP
jgi:cytoskeleton protein RodZ